MSEAGKGPIPNVMITALTQPQARIILLRIPGHHVDRSRLRDVLARLEDFDSSAVHLCHAQSAPETYAYWPLGPHESVDALAHEAQAMLRVAFEGAQAVVLQTTQCIPGASAGHMAHWHYVVETDVLPTAEQDFNDWYSQEHLPGLASVPGTVLAARLRCDRGSPRYHALYLLENSETFGSPAWLAVRATAWSSRVRPNFTNTRRTMFRTVPLPT